jgi:hypothetical protein
LLVNSVRVLPKSPAARSTSFQHFARAFLGGDATDLHRRHLMAADDAAEFVVGAVGVAGGGAVVAIIAATLTGFQARQPAQGVDVAGIALAAELVTVVVVSVAHGALITGGALRVWVAHCRGALHLSAAHTSAEFWQAACAASS